jgi:hypothetical protein
MITESHYRVVTTEQLEPGAIIRSGGTTYQIKKILDNGEYGRVLTLNTGFIGFADTEVTALPGARWSVNN